MKRSIIIKKKGFGLILTIACLALSLSQTSGEAMEKEIYNIPYIADGNHQSRYEELVKSDTSDAKVKNIIKYAKNVARKAGYAIAGDELHLYIFENKKYPLRIEVYENANYYIVIFLPEGTPVTSQNLEISIEKKNNKVIAILKGS